MSDVDALQELRDRVGRLEDLEEIRKLYVDYGRHLDAGDSAAYASLFAKDAKLRLGPVLRADGRAEIEQAAAAMIARIPSGSEHPVHLLGAPRVELSAGAATGECVWAAISTSDDGGQKVLVGRHVDELVREDGQWRVATRRGYIDIGAIPASNTDA